MGRKGFEGDLVAEQREIVGLDFGGGEWVCIKARGGKCCGVVLHRGKVRV